MKATITSALVASALWLGVLVLLGGEARAQLKPEAVRPEAGTPGLKERLEGVRPAPLRPNTPAPSEDAPALQDEMPVPGGCPDQGRPLQLMV
jgi:hypothetical protein